jgi:hypothetical protein
MISGSPALICDVPQKNMQINLTLTAEKNADRLIESDFLLTLGSAGSLES